MSLGEAKLLYVGRSSEARNIKQLNASSSAIQRVPE